MLETLAAVDVRAVFGAVVFGLLVLLCGVGLISLLFPVRVDPRRIEE